MVIIKENITFGGNIIETEEMRNYYLHAYKIMMVVEE